MTWRLIDIANKGYESTPLPGCREGNVKQAFDIMEKENLDLGPDPLATFIATEAKEGNEVGLEGNGTPCEQVDELLIRLKRAKAEIESTIKALEEESESLDQPVVVQNHRFRDDIYSFLRGEGIWPDVIDSDKLEVRGWDLGTITGKVFNFLSKRRIDSRANHLDVTYMFKVYVRSTTTIPQV